MLSVRYDNDVPMLPLVSLGNAAARPVEPDIRFEG